MKTGLLVVTEKGYIFLIPLETLRGKVDKNSIAGQITLKYSDKIINAILV